MLEEEKLKREEEKKMKKMGDTALKEEARIKEKRRGKHCNTTHVGGGEVKKKGG